MNVHFTSQTTHLESTKAAFYSARLVVVKQQDLKKQTQLRRMKVMKAVIIELMSNY